MWKSVRCEAGLANPQANGIGQCEDVGEGGSLRQVMLPFKEVADGRYKVVFCDTDGLPALETKRGDRTTNEFEAALIKQVLHSLTQLILDC